MNIDRFLRRIFPSSSKLTFNPFFKFAVNVADVPGRLMFHEFRNLPPNHMRIRVGVANRFLCNHAAYHAAGTRVFLRAFEAGWCRLDSTIVEIGSGCGRVAQVLRDFIMDGVKFTGRYYGIDIDEEMLEWCRKNFDAERFTFIYSSDRSASYNKTDGSKRPFRIPLRDEIADFVFSGSLFSHLLEPELKNYLAETYRLLKPRCYARHTFFVVDYPPPTFGDRHTFTCRIDNAYVESLEQPEAAVAYLSEYLYEQARATGFKDHKLLINPDRGQHALLLQKDPVTAATAQPTLDNFERSCRPDRLAAV